MKDVLNDGSIGDEVIEQSDVFVRRIRDELDEIYNEYLTDDGKNVNYDALKTSASWKSFQQLVARLKVLDLNTLQGNERTAFFLNIYNILTIHGIIQHGTPSSLWQRLKFYHTTAYCINGLYFSLDKIEHAILRGNRRIPFWFRECSSTDPILKFAIQPFDVRVHFALNCGAKSCPPIRLYSGEKLDAQLTRAVRGFLQDDANIKVDVETKTIDVNMLIWFHQKDFEGGDIKTKGLDAVMETCLEYFPQAKREEISGLLKTGVRYKTIPYDWGLNQSFS